MHIIGTRSSLDCARFYDAHEAIYDQAGLSLLVCTEYVCENMSRPLAESVLVNRGILTRDGGNGWGPCVVVSCRCHKSVKSLREDTLLCSRFRRNAR